MRTTRKASATQTLTWSHFDLASALNPAGPEARKNLLTVMDACSSNLSGTADTWFRQIIQGPAAIVIRLCLAASDSSVIHQLFCRQFTNGRQPKCNRYSRLHNPMRQSARFAPPRMRRSASIASAYISRVCRTHLVLPQSSNALVALQAARHSFIYNCIAKTYNMLYASILTFIC